MTAMTARMIAVRRIPGPDGLLELLISLDTSVRHIAMRNHAVVDLRWLIEGMIRGW